MDNENYTLGYLHAGYADSHCTTCCGPCLFDHSCLFGLVSVVGVQTITKLYVHDAWSSKAVENIL